MQNKTTRSAKNENKIDLKLTPTVLDRFGFEKMRGDLFSVTLASSLAAAGDTAAFKHRPQLTARTLVTLALAFHSDCDSTNLTETV